MKGSETFIVDYDGNGTYDDEWLSLDQANRMSCNEVVRHYIDPGHYRWAKSNEMALLYSVLGMPGNSKATRQMSSLAGISIGLGFLYTVKHKATQAEKDSPHIFSVETLGWHGGLATPMPTVVHEPRYFPALIKTEPK
ncbi:hypothetical protein [Desulfobacula toluolica]|nr:hypothetical protein [Desulfobacula toluolica]